MGSCTRANQTSSPQDTGGCNICNTQNIARNPACRLAAGHCNTFLLHFGVGCVGKEKICQHTPSANTYNTSLLLS